MVPAIAKGFRGPHRRHLAAAVEEGPCLARSSRASISFEAATTVAKASGAIQDRVAQSVPLESIKPSPHVISRLGVEALEAARLLGWTEIAAVVRDETDDQAYILSVSGSAL